MVDNLQELISQLKSGELKLRELEAVLGANDAALVRSAFLETQLGLSLSGVKAHSLNAQSLHNKNIENLIGSVEIPVGVAGPVQINSLARNGSFSHFVPMATTEGALVASISRGMKALSLAGGVNVSVEYLGMTRAPLFRAASYMQAKALVKWVEANFNKLADAASATSSHLQLLKIQPHVLTREVWLRLSFDTQDAMGMNMASKASQAICDVILAEWGKSANADGNKNNNNSIELIALSGNLCVDKKPSQLGLVEGRGYRAVAEIVMDETLVVEQLKASPAQIANVNALKVWRAGALAGTTAYNAQVGNVIAAVFAATGQDLAHVSDSVQASTVIEYSEGQLYAAVDMSNLPLGSVGGGTSIAKQSELLALAVAGVESDKSEGEAFSDGNSKDELVKDVIRPAVILAEVIAAASLAGELSLHAALASGSLVGAHQALGKGKN
jgi:hydroxymethylglutaryl-CoA reductase (NADPH)